MSKSTKKTLIIAGIITLIYVLVFFYICKAEACDKTGVYAYPILIYPEVSAIDLLYHGNIEETNRAWQRMNEFLNRNKKLDNVIESKITVDKPCEFKKGDSVWDVVKGKGIVVEIEESNIFSVKVKIDKKGNIFYLPDGRYTFDDTFPSLYKREMKIVPVEKTIYPIFETNVGTLTSNIISRIEKLEKKVEALNNMLSEAGIGTLTNSD